VLFFVSILLREICVKPLDDVKWADVLHSEAFLVVLKSCLTFAVKAFRQQVGRRGGSVTCKQPDGAAEKVSPLSHHLTECNLANIFEHLFVCLRHLLVRAMFIETRGTREGQWRWDSSQVLAMHRDAWSWIPDVVKTYEEALPTVVMEAIRYSCAIHLSL
jgi:hypothetical protein